MILIRMANFGVLPEQIQVHQSICQAIISGGFARKNFVQEFVLSELLTKGGFSKESQDSCRSLIFSGGFLPTYFWQIALFLFRLWGGGTSSIYNLALIHEKLDYLL